MMNSFKLAAAVALCIFCITVTVRAQASPWVTDRVIRVEINMTPTDWNKMVGNPDDSEYYPANITYDGEFVSNVGVRIKGNSSRRGAQQAGQNRYSLKLKANEYVKGQKVLGEKKLNFNNGFKDASFMHEYLSYSIMRNYFAASRTTYGDMYINGGHMGLYTVVEQVDETFFKDNGYDFLDGDLYRVGGPPDGYCTYRGSDLSAYHNTELKSNEDTSTGAPYTNMLYTLNDDFSAIEGAMNVTQVLQHLASQIAFVNLDSAAGDGNNIFWYQAKDSDQHPQMNLLAWDQNEAFGTFGCQFSHGPMDGPMNGHMQAPPKDGPREVESRQMGPPQHEDLTTLDVYTPCNSTQSVLFSTLIPARKNEYNHWLHSICTGPMQPNVIDPQITATANLIRPYVHKDPTKFYTNEEFECAVRSASDPQRPTTCDQNGQSIPDWIAARVKSVLTQIE